MKVFDWCNAQISDITTNGVFDIGCGDASLLLAFASKAENFKLAGCEPSWNLEPIIKSNNNEIQIHSCKVEDIICHELNGFGLYILFDVIEHLLDPVEFLSTLMERTKKNDNLFISTNCIDHYNEIPAGGFDNYYLRLAHTFTFSKATLDAMLKISGWEIEAFKPAPKGDQWILAKSTKRKEEVDFSSIDDLQRVKSCIEKYKFSCGKKSNST